MSNANYGTAKIFLILKKNLTVLPSDNTLHRNQALLWRVARELIISCETLLIISRIDPDSQRCSAISEVVISLDSLAANSQTKFQTPAQGSSHSPSLDNLTSPFFIALSLFFPLSNILLLRYNNRLKQQLPQKNSPSLFFLLLKKNK